MLISQHLGQSAGQPHRDTEKNRKAHSVSSALLGVTLCIYSSVSNVLTEKSVKADLLCFDLKKNNHQQKQTNVPNFMLCASLSISFCSSMSYMLVCQNKKVTLINLQPKPKPKQPTPYVSLHSFFSHLYLPHPHAMLPLAIGRSNVFSFDLIRHTPWFQLLNRVATQLSTIWLLVMHAGSVHGCTLRWQQQQLSAQTANTGIRLLTYCDWLTLPLIIICIENSYIVVTMDSHHGNSHKANPKVAHVFLSRSFFSIQSYVCV